MALIEIMLTDGQRVRVEGDSPDVEATILAAARGSIMELAWVTDVETGERLGINPEHVLMLRILGPAPGQS